MPTPADSSPPGSPAAPVPAGRVGWPVFLIVTVLCLLPLITLVSRDDRGRWALNRCTMSTPDEPSYLLIAKSLMTGHGISTVAVAGKDTFYPPGLPLMLAAWGKVFGLTPQSAHVCVALTMAAALATGFVLLRRVFALWGWGDKAPWAAAGCMAVFATSYHVMDVTLFVFSEPLFTLCVFAWLYAGLRLDRWWARPGAAAGVALLAVACAMTRGAGIVCVGTTVVYVLIGPVLRRRHAPVEPVWRGLAALGAAAGVILAYYATLHVLSPEKSIASAGASENSYTRQLLRGVGFDLDPASGALRDTLWRPDVWGPRVLRTASAQAYDHVQDWVSSLVPPHREEDDPFRPELYAWLGRVLLLVALAGWAARLVKGRPAKTRFVELFVFAYVGLYLVWPFRMVRFWVPILPLVAAYAADALRHDWRGLWARPRAARGHAALCVVLLGLAVALNLQEIALRLPWYQRRLNYVSDALAAAAATVRRRAPDPARAIVCVDDEAYFAFTWYLNPGAADAGYRVSSARRGERIEAMIRRNLGAVRAAPAKRLFVLSYFGHDPRQHGEPTLLYVLQNLQRQYPDEFAQSDPDAMGFHPAKPAAPGQWEIVKLQQDWNVTAVWEIRAVIGHESAVTGPLSMDGMSVLDLAQDDPQQVTNGQ